jgi:16S rRNA (cytosine967-C5)-methyltransferase
LGGQLGLMVQELTETTALQARPGLTPLWQQLQATAIVLMAVYDGQTLTSALKTVEKPLKPGVQALGFYVLRQLGLAQALRAQLAKRAPPPAADALLCVALALLANSPAQMAGAQGSSDKSGQLALAGHSPDGSPQYDAHTLVNQAVEAAKKQPDTTAQASFLNACLRRFIREREALMAQALRDPVAQWNHPRWWVKRLKNDHPQHWQAVLEANNSRAPLIIRVNTTKTSNVTVISSYAAMQIEAIQLQGNALMLPQAGDVTQLPGYAEGWFSVQDCAAQMAAPLLLGGLAPRADGQSLRILDACAAPGGKTAHLAELCAAQGIAATVVALEIDPQRSERIHENLARLGLAAQVVVADASKPDTWWDGQPFDAILLDAPCTASGIVRRHADVRWLRRETDVDQLAAVQKQLLNALWPLLAAGGQMLYCTCSVFRAEGANQVQAFVMHHTDAALLPSPGHLLPSNHGKTPAVAHNLGSEHDGFYYALLKKQPA